VARTCAVTGGTGFLGRHLVRALAQAGWRVRVLARRDPAQSDLGAAFGELEVEVVSGGLEEAALARLCQGAEVLVHAAGLVKARSRSEFIAVNAQGAGLAAAAARAAGARMVLVSSLAAREPQLSHYAASKRAGEDLAAQVLGDSLSIVRPPVIYGPGDRETLQVFKAAARSPVLPVLDPRARIAMIHVEDAAAQIAAAAADPPEPACVALSDSRPDGYSWREIARAAAGATGRSPLMLRIPAAAISVAGLGGSLAGRFGAPAMLTLGKARELRWLDWSVKMEERWLAAPPTKFALIEGFGQTVRWWREAEGLML
jgi:nucleoside-diphosphate-sugar epimerase